MFKLSSSYRRSICLTALALFLLWPHSMNAQTYQTPDDFLKGHIAPGLDGEVKSKTEFVYAFYKAYMYGIIYEGDICDVLRGGVLSKKVLKMIEDTYADVLIDAQDCGVEELKTLYVEPLKDDWFKVTFHRFTGVQNPPDRMVEVHVKVETVPSKERKKFSPLYKIVDLVNVEPSLTASSHTSAQCSGFARYLRLFSRGLTNGQTLKGAEGTEYIDTVLVRKFVTAGHCGKSCDDSNWWDTSTLYKTGDYYVGLLYNRSSSDNGICIPWLFVYDKTGKIMDCVNLQGDYQYDETVSAFNNAYCTDHPFSFTFMFGVATKPYTMEQDVTDCNVKICQYSVGKDGKLSRKVLAESKRMKWKHDAKKFV